MSIKALSHCSESSGAIGGLWSYRQTSRQHSYSDPNCSHGRCTRELVCDSIGHPMQKKKHRRKAAHLVKDEDESRLSREQEEEAEVVSESVSTALKEDGQRQIVDETTTIHQQYEECFFSSV